MNTWYPTGTALRAALEKRLLAQHSGSGLLLDRLRKQAALQRLLARIAEVAPEGQWSLKGGMAMIARVGARGRATVDADINWWGESDGLQEMLTKAAAVDLGDHFEFEIGSCRPIRPDSEDSGLRFAVDSRLDDRRFEAARIDVNVLSGDPRPVEVVAMAGALDFAGFEPPAIPVIRAEDHLAEKLHAYTYHYGDSDNSRPGDLYDMLVIAEELEIPPVSDLAAACRGTFEMRDTAWPPVLAAPPESWASAWAGFKHDYGIRFRSIDEAYAALEAFWAPVLQLSSEGLADNLRWDASGWCWQ